MTQFIILTLAERNAIRGHSSPLAAIEPVELSDGTFVIGDEVLADPAHTTRITRIAGLRQKARVEKAAIDALQRDPGGK
jgi:hypothetical protein